MTNPMKILEKKTKAVCSETKVNITDQVVQKTNLNPIKNLWSGLKINTYVWKPLNLKKPEEFVHEE